MEDTLTYANAGVDIDKANAFISTVKQIARQTPRSGVMAEIGGFSGLFSLNTANIDNPVLSASTDGVGTKLKIAFMMNRHDTVGIDLVAMCVNDIVVQGARPLFFLDYLSMGRLNVEVATDVIKGIGEGCKMAQCALIGGETAEMPGFYPNDEYDLAGFAVGIVDDAKIIDGSEIRVGHMLVSIPSSGLHSNGYSLVRKICFEKMKMSIDTHVPELGRTIGEELLEPTRIYVETVFRVLRGLPIHGLAHITGGGIYENIVRILPAACSLVIKRGSWDIPPVFDLLKKGGNISEMEMMRTFNNGIGMVAIVPESAVADVMERLGAGNEKASVIGEVVECKGPESRIEWV